MIENREVLIPTNQPHFPIAAFSHVGLVRENNEDRLEWQAFITQADTFQNVLLAVLADGVGGHRAGEIAARIAVESVLRNFAACQSLEHPTELLTQAFLAANEDVLRQSQSNEVWSGMGSTCVCALLINSRLYAANLGDSRLYLARGQRLQQLTYDHTWLEEIARRDRNGADNIGRRHPLAHVLNRYLGTTEPVQVDVRLRPLSQNSNEVGFSLGEEGLEMLPGDSLLLTSDGVSELLTNDEMAAVVTIGTPQEAAQNLVNLALEKGGHDNASVIVIRKPDMA